MKNESRYTLPHRLSDVIALISVLAQHQQAFMNEALITTALRGSPKSKENAKSNEALTWQKIVENHHEFFRSNGNNDFFALVIRSYFPLIQDPHQPEIHDALIRQTLTVDETQNLINVAVSLHGKELERIQKNSYKVPIIVAVIALCGVLFSVIYTSHKTDQTNIITNQKIDSLKNDISGLANKIDYKRTEKSDTNSNKSKFKRKLDNKSK